jgi:hypothetical protein
MKREFNTAQQELINFKHQLKDQEKVVEQHKRQAYA